MSAEAAADVSAIEDHAHRTVKVTSEWAKRARLFDKKLASKIDAVKSAAEQVVQHIEARSEGK